MGLDGESVIKKLQQDWLPSPKDSHYDLLLDCKRRMEKLPIDVQFRWIEGHQDEKSKSWGRLDWWALQNIRMDSKAKKHLRKTKKCTPPNIRFEHENWAVWLNGKKLSSFTKKAVYEVIHTSDAENYWKNKESNPLSDDQWNSFNKKAYKKAHQERPHGKNRFDLKFATGHFGCGRQMLRRKTWTHSNCPVCGASDEHNCHVLRCHAVSARADRKSTRLNSSHPK